MSSSRAWEWCTPLGCGVEPTWQRLLAGESGARKIDSFDVSDICLPRSPARSRAATAPTATFNPDQWMEPKEQRKVDEFIIYAMCAARQALDDAGWTPNEHDEQIATGVLIGSGIGGIEGIAETAITLQESGPRRVSPFFIPGRIINLASGYVSIAFGLKGPNHAVVTACSTGAHAIGDAGAADRARRRRRDGRRRHGIAGQPDLARRLRRLPRALDRLQRRPDRRPRGPTTGIATAS